MCVIFLVNKARPSDEMVARAYDHNKDGVGVAWREGKGDRAEVVWQKGIMELAYAQELARTLPIPYVMHFRVASVGGVKQSLTHPFLIGKEASLELEGRTKGGVLFHNGHWTGWNDKVLEAAIHSNTKIPVGADWSDTRGMAFMTHIYGPGFMELLTSQKGVIMTTEKFNVFTGNGWEKINEVWCSNDFFWKSRSHQHHGGHSGNTGSAGNGSYSSTYRRMCTKGRCTKNVVPGTDMCEDCTKEFTPVVTVEKEKDTTSAVAIVTGGTARPLAKTFTLAEVETLYREGQKAVSKTILKKYKKLNGVVGKGGNREVRAKSSMLALSQRIAEQLLHGFPD